MPDDEHYDSVEKPKHYHQGGMQPWDYAILHKMGFLEGNIVKYITRYTYKNGKEDLLKARAYINKLIDTYEES